MMWRLLSFGIVFATLTGCNSSEPTPDQKQDAALKDPMNYKPDMDRSDGNSDLLHFDRSGFNKDLNDVLGP